MKHRLIFIVISALLGACASRSPEPVPIVADYEAPLSLEGSWERDYSRDDDVNAVLQRAYNLLSRSQSDQRLPGSSPGLSRRDAEGLLALARLAELITRPDVLTIAQSETEIHVERKDDFTMRCAFYDGVAKSTGSNYGHEICGWDGNHLLSLLELPGGLRILHRFVRSEDGQRLRVTTTLTSQATRVPFTLHRFYRKFERLPPEYNCIETLSMKRVCSTGELVL